MILSKLVAVAIIAAAGSVLPLADSIECGEELALYPAGRVPNEIPGAFGPEKHVHTGGETHV